MKNFRKLGILTLSTGLSIGILSPSASAAPLGNEQHNNVQIQIAQVESVVTKSQLIKKFKEFFPQFSHINESEFHMGRGHQFPEDDTIRYDLSFHRTVKGKQEYGSVGFIGEKLEIERYNYQPANAVDALFPAKVTREKAKELAQAFLKKFTESSDYQLDPEHYEYFPDNQILTEPIRYSFSFVHTKNKIPLSDQRIQITVLGNGEIGDFYRNLSDAASSTFDDSTKILSEKEIIAKMKENLSVELQYRIDFDYRTSSRDVNLVYQLTNDVLGIHALSGDWQTINGFSSKLPKRNKIERIVEGPIHPSKANISLEEAKALAEKLLAIDSKDIKLRIESVDERKNPNGQEVISIQFMYEYQNGGTGTSLELDKHTGEIIQYHDLKSDVLREHGQSKNNTVQTISSEEALKQAVKYLKQYSPSHLHNYAMPIGESYVNEERGIHHFSFPRVVNGILVNGDQISVSVSGDGSLQSLTVNQSNFKSWPSLDEVISKDKATELFFKQLSLNLSYAKEGYGKKSDHYHLVYLPSFSSNPLSFLDAKTGEWTSRVEENRHVVSHPWAEKELNYLIHNGIIDVKDAKKFDANAKLTKGAALEVIMKSLTRFYPDYYRDQNNKGQSFENIKPDHPLYQVVERAVALGLLEKEGATINLDTSITREDLAVWYIRTLGLEQAAKSQGIYQLKFADAKDVKPENVGFVALAQSLGLLTTNNNKFNPKQEVSYADLAVSAVRLARDVYDKGIRINY